MFIAVEALAAVYYCPRLVSRHAFALKSTALISQCHVPLCIVAHGLSTSDGFLALGRYLSVHSQTPAIFYSTQSQHVQVFNMDMHDQHLHEFTMDTFRQQRHQTLSAAINAMTAGVLRSLRPCSILELDTSLTMMNQTQGIVSQIDALLQSAAPAPGDILAIRLGARPRSFTNGYSDAKEHHAPPVLNAYPLFSPSRYYAPRGIPDEIIRADRQGKGSNSPELIRLSVPKQDDIGVVQSVIDGLPDVALSVVDDVGPITHDAIVNGLVVPSGTFHPYNQRATFHRYGATWAMFLPVCVDPIASDVLRSYIAQAIFPLLGLHVALVAPLFSANASTRLSAPANTPSWLAIVSYLVTWNQDMEALCLANTSHKDCRDAGTLLVKAYTDLEQAGHASADDVSAAKAWVDALEQAGYEMPQPTHDVQANSVKILSPPRPSTHNIHAAVHVNWGKSWKGVVPLWHAMHAAEFRQVTYHVQRRADAADPSPIPSIYPEISFALDDPPEVTSGYLAYESAIQSWAVHDQTTDAMLWMHEDAFVRSEFLSDWLTKSSTCVAMGEHSQLPVNVSQWENFWWKPWPQDHRTQLAAKHFMELGLSRISRPRCFGHDLGTGLPFGHADIVAMRTVCANSTIQQTRLFDLLQAASDAGLFMEIGWPASIRCAFPADKIHEYKLYTRFDRRRNSAELAWDEFTKEGHDSYHPVKFSPNILTRLRMRDHSWDRQRRLSTAVPDPFR